MRDLSLVRLTPKPNALSLTKTNLIKQPDFSVHMGYPPRMWKMVKQYPATLSDLERCMRNPFPDVYPAPVPVDRTTPDPDTVQGFQQLLEYNETPIIGLACRSRIQLIAEEHASTWFYLYLRDNTKLDGIFDRLLRSASAYILPPPPATWLYKNPKFIQMVAREVSTSPQYCGIYQDIFTDMIQRIITNPRQALSDRPDGSGWIPSKIDDAERFLSNRNNIEPIVRLSTKHCDYVTFYWQGCAHGFQHGYEYAKFATENYYVYTPHNTIIELMVAKRFYFFDADVWHHWFTVTAGFLKDALMWLQII